VAERGFVVSPTLSVVLVGKYEGMTRSGMCVFVCVCVCVPCMYA
jgi:hypothetical protein